jgi:hypothetical protein
MEHKTQQSDPATTAIKAWERQEGESQEAYEAFEQYLGMGAQRSLVKVAKLVGKSHTLIERWSVRDQWQGRVVHHDRWRARALNEEILLGTAEMRQRAIKTAMAIQARVAQRVTNMSKAEIAKLRPREIAALFNSATKAEASARDISLDDLDDDEHQIVPTFQINFLPSKPEGFVAVRLRSGEAGYIPRDQVARFKADYPDAVVID